MITDINSEDRLVQQWEGRQWENQVYFVGICIFTKIIERKKGYY